MKKVISIGRGDGADINIDNDLVSRRHATIKFLPFGKMEIRDLSKNGTYVNGIRLAVNKPYPVTRKDVVSFARVSQLDWGEVPDPMRFYKIGVYAVLALLLCVAIIAIVSRIDWGDKDKSDEKDPYQTEEYVEKKADDVKDKQSPSKENADKSTVKEVDRTIPNLFPKKDKDKTKDQNKDKTKDKDGNKKEEKDKAKGSDTEKKGEENQNSWIM